jgi:hypothetical protein
MNISHNLNNVERFRMSLYPYPLMLPAIGLGENTIVRMVKLPAHRAGLPGKEQLIYIAPLDPAYKAGLAGAPPVNSVNVIVTEESTVRLLLIGNQMDEGGKIFLSPLGLFYRYPLNRYQVFPRFDEVEIVHKLFQGNLVELHLHR